MNFDKEFPDFAGYVVYNILIDFLEELLISYSNANKGKYPSLRTTTDSFLNFIETLNKIDLDKIKASEDIPEVVSIVQKAMMEIVENRKSSDLLSTKKLGLFKEGPETTECPSTNVESDVIPPFKINISDKRWLQSVNIREDN